MEQAAHSLAQGSSTLHMAARLQDQLLVASNDLDRLQTLLSDACALLMQRFGGASDQIHVLMGSQGPLGAGAQDREACEVLMQQLAGAVTALQFQDMASQLIVHTNRSLRNCADTLAREAFGDDDEDGGTVVEAAPTRPNPVTQAEMDAGSIELF